MTGETQPTLPLPDAAAPTAARRPRRALPWIIAVVVVAVLAVVAWFVAELITRDILTRTVREQIITQLALPADHPIDVGVDEPVLLQVIAGELSRLDVSSAAVPFGDVVADVSVRARDVPIRGDGDIGSAEATVSFGEDQLQTLLSSIDGVPESGVALVPPAARIDVDLQLFALTVPVGVDLAPSADAGDIVLTPTAVRVSGAEVSADALRRQFGVAAEALLSPREICIADRLPAGLLLREVRVEPGELVAEVSVDGAIIHDETLQANGTCA